VKVKIYQNTVGGSGRYCCLFHCDRSRFRKWKNQLILKRWKQRSTDYSRKCILFT